jgi:FAD/FMN-containing dehydrogenase
LSELDRQGGFTLPSVGLISEQAIAGAIATGTHGSGKHSLSHYVSAVRLATYDPDSGAPVIRTISAGDELRAARCSLGCLGIVLSVQMQVRPQYFVEEHLRQYQTLDEVLAAEEQYPLQQFFLIPWRWTYLAQHRREVPGPRSLLAPLYRAYWFTTLDIGLHLLLQILVKVLRSPALIRAFFRWLALWTVIRGWRVVDRSQDQLIMEHELFRHIEIELFVARSKLAPALDFVRETIESSRSSYTHHYVICIRKVLPDDTLISMSSGLEEPSYAISLISYARPSQRAGFFGFAEFLTHEMSRRFDARPHWGKYCPLTSEEAEQLYPRLGEFRAICRQADPHGLFRNNWTAHIVIGDRAVTPPA